jgi:hypothetical protein
MLFIRHGLVFSHASGTTIIITSGNERPVINNNSIYP